MPESQKECGMLSDSQCSSDQFFSFRQVETPDTGIVATGTATCVPKLLDTNSLRRLMQECDGNLPEHSFLF